MLTPLVGVEVILLFAVLEAEGIVAVVVEAEVGRVMAVLVTVLQDTAAPKVTPIAGEGADVGAVAVAVKVEVVVDHREMKLSHF